MLRHTNDAPSDLIFEAEEDLYHAPSKTIIMLATAEKTVSFTKKRPFQSYINEFCGMTGLASNTLRF